MCRPFNLFLRFKLQHFPLCCVLMSKRRDEAYAEEEHWYRIAK